MKAEYDRTGRTGLKDRTGKPEHDSQYWTDRKR
jgi:hypothetical protein